MSFLFYLVLSCCVLLCVRTATHDEIPQCTLVGVYKARQNVLESPNYPDNYPVNTCWDYVIRSPYHCPTTFHIQFLDFFLESSTKCANDYLAIGLENDDNDMDLLCGQVVGIKKYHTPDGILRMRFFSDQSPWTRGKGFKLIVTRLACERDEDLQRNNNNNNNNDDNNVAADDDDGDVDAEDEDDTVVVNATPHRKPQIPNRNILRNLTQQDQYQRYPVQPVFGWNIPNVLPYPPPPFGVGGVYQPIGQQIPPISTVQYPLSTTERPCPQTETQQTPPPVQTYPPTQTYWATAQQQPQQQIQQILNQQVPLIPDQYRGTLWAGANQPFYRSSTSSQTATPKQADSQLAPPLTEGCCISSFRQKHLYLSSPGFPRTVFSALLPTQHRDCEFSFEKAESSICRMRFEFKFFDFGQTYTGTGLKPNNIDIAIGTSRDICHDDYIEIDGERFCGCRSGYVYTSIWPAGKKTLRMRMGYSGIPSNGFLLELRQEECNGDEMVNPGGVNRIYGGFQQPLQQPLQQPYGLTQNNLYLPQNGVPPLQQTRFGQIPQYPQIIPQPQQFLQQQPYQPYPLTTPQQQQQTQLWNPQMQTNGYPFGLQAQWPLQYGRNGRALKAAESSQQPISVVETNSTRKEFYFYDGDEAFQERALKRQGDEPEDTDRLNLKYARAQLRNRCSFDTSDILQLTVDRLWIMKPICYAPIRSWFSNMFG